MWELRYFTFLSASWNSPKLKSIEWNYKNIGNLHKHIFRDLLASCLIFSGKSFRVITIIIYDKLWDNLSVAEDRFF